MRGHRFLWRVFKKSHRLGWHPPCSKKKHKWNIKTEKKLFCLYFNNTSFTLLDFCWNKVYFKYTSEFADKYISLESLLQVYLSFKINMSILKVFFKYTSEFEKKCIKTENLFLVYFWVYTYISAYISFESLLQVCFWVCK